MEISGRLKAILELLAHFNKGALLIDGLGISAFLIKLLKSKSYCTFKSCSVLLITSIVWTYFMS